MIPLQNLCRSNGLPVPIPEHRFAPPRKWRIDYAWPEYKLALEIEGGIWTFGRHVRGKGFLSDIEKYNTLTLLGWYLLRATPQDVQNLKILLLLQKFFSSYPKFQKERL